MEQLRIASYVIAFHGYQALDREVGDEGLVYVFWIIVQEREWVMYV